MRVCELTHLSGLLTAGKTGPDWRQAFTCTVVLRLLISLSPKITALFAQGLSGEVSGYPTSPRRNLKPPPPAPLSLRSHFTRRLSCWRPRPDPPPPHPPPSVSAPVSSDHRRRVDSEAEAEGDGYNWFLALSVHSKDTKLLFLSQVRGCFFHYNIFRKVMAPEQHLFV